MNEFKLQNCLDEWRSCFDPISKFVCLERIGLQESFLVQLVQLFVHSVEQKDLKTLGVCFEMIFAFQSHRQLFKALLERLMIPSTLCALYKLDLLQDTDCAHVMRVCSFYFHLYIRMFESKDQWTVWFDKVDFVANYCAFVSKATKVVEQNLAALEMHEFASQVKALALFRAMTDHFRLLYYFCCNSPETRTRFQKHKEILYEAWGKMLLLSYRLSVLSSKSSASFPAEFALLVSLHPLYKVASVAKPLFVNVDLLLDGIFSIVSAAILFLEDGKFVFSVEDIVTEQQLFELLQSRSMPLPFAKYIYPLFLLLHLRMFLLQGNALLVHLFQQFPKHVPKFPILNLFLHAIQPPISFHDADNFAHQELLFALYRSEAGSICSSCRRKADRSHPHLMRSPDQRRIVEFTQKEGLHYDHVVLPTCSKCKITLYCGKNCQQKHWKEHKHACRAFCK